MSASEPKVVFPRPVPILFLNKNNKNNRIYPQEVVEKAIEEYKDKEVFGIVGSPGSLNISLHDVAFVTSNMYIEHEVLWTSVKILDTPAGKALTKILIEGLEICVRPIGTGHVVNGKVEDYKIFGMSIIPKSVDSFS